jgi:hypothetical protein
MHGSHYRDAVASCVEILLSHGASLEEPDNGYYLGKGMLSSPLGIAVANQAMDETIINVLLEKHLLLKSPPDVRVLFNASLKMTISTAGYLNCYICARECHGITSLAMKSRAKLERLFYTTV